MKNRSLHPAFILHRRPYSNTSLLLECFTASYGRFPVIAKGINNKRSGLNGLLQPFSSLLIDWCGKGEVKTLVTCEPGDSVIRLSKKALYCGFYLNELMMRLLERLDPHARLFESYSESLHKLADGIDVEQVLRRYELILLAELGYGVNLSLEAETGDPVDPEKCYRYVVEHGPVLMGSESDFSISGSTLLALERGDQLNTKERKEARALMRRVLTHYLGDKPIKSRELFQVL